MRKLLFILSIVLLSACTNQADSQSNNVEDQDTATIVSSTIEVIDTESAKEQPERDIAWIVESENIYKDDPSVLKNLYKAERDVIVRGTILESNADNDAVFLQELLDVDFYTPVTLMKIQINEVILGEIDSSIDTVYVTGGTVSLQELYLNLPEGTVNRLELNDLSESERFNQYVRYEEEADLVFETGKEYILVISITPGFPNQVIGNGYGTFISSGDQARGGNSFVNAISGRDFSSELDSIVE